MSQHKERETVVALLYLKSMSGDILPDEYPENIIARTEQIWEKTPELDAVISENLKDWTIDRLNYVDKAILRNAVYELMFTDLPAEIVLDEAIELTKTYTNLDDDKARAFNNKLLDNIKKFLNK
jgi:N utilization substance protein B